MSRLRYEFVRTPLGLVAIVASSKGVCRLILPGYSASALRRWILRAFPDAREGRIGLGNIAGRIGAYLEGRRVNLRCPVDLFSGTALEKRVWRACAGIPYGQRRTYGELARMVGTSARAVGRALGRNPVPILVPCHRVIRADGGLGGFSARGGAALKRRLLGLETRTSS